MTTNELKVQIIQGNLDNLFMFYGEESKVQNIYIHKIAEALNGELVYVDKVEESFDDGGGTLFAEQKCYVCIDPVELIKATDVTKEYEKILQKLGGNRLILQFTKLDKRSKLYNLCKDKGVEFALLHQIVATKHLREQLDINQITAEKLFDVCEGDYGRCLLELDKVKNYDPDNPNAGFKTLLDNKIIYEPPTDAIFDFVGAVLAGKPKLSFSLLQECKDIGEPSLRLLLVLFTNTKQLLQVQACKNDIEKTTGLSSWQIRNVQKYQGVYKNHELIRAMKLIREVEMGIKLGKIDEQIAVEYVLVNMF